MTNCQAGLSNKFHLLPTLHYFKKRLFPDRPAGFNVYAILITVGIMSCVSNYSIRI